MILSFDYFLKCVCMFGYIKLWLTKHQDEELLNKIWTILTLARGFHDTPLKYRKERPFLSKCIICSVYHGPSI